MTAPSTPCSIEIELGSLWRNVKTGRVAEVVWFDERKLYTQTIVTARKYGGGEPPRASCGSMPWKAFFRDWECAPPGLEDRRKIKTSEAEKLRGA